MHNNHQRAKWLARMLMLLMLAWLAACSSPDGSTMAEDAGDETDSLAHDKEAKLVGYLIGDAPEGLPAVLDAINAKLKKDINATIELNYIGWSDLASKYPFVLASGENVDFIFAAEWSFYMSEATKGAFYPLSKELLEKYMPRQMAKLPKEAIEAAYVDGVPYMIPSATPDQKVNVALFRKDIMEKAGMKEITKFSEIEPYLATIKREYPDMIPLNLDSQFDLSTPFSHLMSEQIAWRGNPFDSGDPSAQGITADMEDPSGKILSTIEEPMLSLQMNAARTMKDWYDKGYINMNPYSNKIRSKDSICEGKTGVAFGNSIDTVSVFGACKEKGIEIYAFPQRYPSGKASQASWLNNGVAIGANSKHPERTLEALDLLMADEDYVNLAYLGIEGINYAVTPDGKAGLPEGVTFESNAYPPDASGFWFVSKDLIKPMSTWTDAYIRHREQVANELEPTLYMNFSFNPEKVKTEVANMKSVSTQYAQPIYIGAVPDVDEAFDTLISRLKAAGIDRVKAEVERQASQYRANIVFQIHHGSTP